MAVDGTGPCTHPPCVGRFTDSDSVQAGLGAREDNRLKSYYRVMLGRKSAFAEQCFDGNFIGADFDIAEDLTRNLPDEWRAFNSHFIPIYLAQHPEKNRISAGLACGALWTIAKGIRKGDFVLSPDGSGTYRVGE